MAQLAAGKVRAHVVIDKAVLQRVQELAKRERRTVSAQIQVLLELAMAPAAYDSEGHKVR